jgi:hypothetical protein
VLSKVVQSLSSEMGSVNIVEISTAEVPIKSSVSLEEYIEVGGEDMVSVQRYFPAVHSGSKSRGVLGRLCISYLSFIHSIPSITSQSFSWMSAVLQAISIFISSIVERGVWITADSERV